MKEFCKNAVVIVLLFAAYAFGQNNQQKPVKHCCCEHTQQIADDLHWIRNQLSKPFIPPPDIIFNNPGLPINAIVDELKKLNQQFEGDFVGKPHPTPSNPGPPADPGPPRDPGPPKDPGPFKRL